jgi:D-alanine-D-alanine ligase
MEKTLIKRKRKYTVALLYHFVPKKEKISDEEHTLTDGETGTLIPYFKRVFESHDFRVQIIKIRTDNYMALKKVKADYIFNLVDSTEMYLRIGKILTKMSIPFSGASLVGMRISSNKLLMKKMFDKYYLSTPKYTIIHMKDRITRDLVPSKFPIIVKPAFEHCSIGITVDSIATNYRDFRYVVKMLRSKFSQTLLAEEFIAGREFQVTVLDTPRRTIAFPIAEIKFRYGKGNKWNIYGYDEKWNKNVESYKYRYFVAPAPGVPKDIMYKIKKECIRAFHAFNMRDYARFDLRYSPERKMWYFLEANATCDLDPSPKEATTTSVKARGMTLDEFIISIVNDTLEKREQLMQ